MPDSDSLIQNYESKQQHNMLIDGFSIQEQVRLEEKHTWNVSALEFSPNGLYLASGSWDKTACIWDLRTLNNPKMLDGQGKGHSSALTCLKWLPQIEFLLASGSADCSVLIWNSDSGEIMGRLNQHETWILDITFSSNGQKMASSSRDGHVYVWDINTLKPVNQLLGHKLGVQACEFDRNSSSPILCTASEDTSLRLWDLRADGKWYSDVILSGLHNGAIKCCSWSPCGNYLAAGASDAKISVWDIRANKAINCLRGHNSGISGVCFLPSSSYLLLSVGGTRCSLWNTFDPKGLALGSIQQHAWSYEVECLTITPDSTLIATGGVDKTIVLSTIDSGDSFYERVKSNIDVSPYAQLPVKTYDTVPQLGKSSADFVDYAKTAQENLEKEKERTIAKQTIRIKAPVTSDFLKQKLSILKSEKKEKMFLETFKQQQKPFSEGFKSKEILNDPNKFSLLQMKDEKRRQKNNLREHWKEQEDDGGIKYEDQKPSSKDANNNLEIPEIKMNTSTTNNGDGITSLHQQATYF